MFENNYMVQNHFHVIIYSCIFPFLWLLDQYKVSRIFSLGVTSCDKYEQYISFPTKVTFLQCDRSFSASAFSKSENNKASEFWASLGIFFCRTSYKFFQLEQFPNQVPGSHMTGIIIRLQYPPAPVLQLLFPNKTSSLDWDKCT